ncbi:MAG: catechol 1,2-dioxygenase [Alphaproteobacteria bacterium]|nr:catechol 1,2-dioxygenase [Alphaproteobacteria bacterium]
MILTHESQLTDAVLADNAGTADKRLREIVASFIRHAHAFLRETRPTEEEFHAGLQFIAAVGRRTSERHNEVVLASDVFGLSTLVGMLNNPLGSDHTAAALLGPFWRQNAPHAALGDNIARSNTPGPALFVRGTVRDTGGKPIPGATVDVWQASPVGLYENQDPEQDDYNLRGVFRADAEGKFHFRTVKPAGYPVPVDGPIGGLLHAQRRHPYRPAHLHFMISHPGYKTLITQVFPHDAEDLDRDVTFSVIAALVADCVRHEGDAPAPDVTGPWYSMAYDFALERGEQRFPAPPIR